MRKRWNLPRVLLTLAFSAATFAVAFALGFPITAALGPGTSGIVTIMVTTILVVIGARIIGTVGVFTLMVGMFTVFAMPTNLFGPPGFQKILIGLLTGLTYDLGWLLFERLRLGKFVLGAAAAIATAVSILLIYWLVLILGHPTADRLGPILVYIVPLYAALGFAGGLAGELLYRRRIQHLRQVKSLESIGRKTGNS